jgi:citrate lyase beta subunit
VHTLYGGAQLFKATTTARIGELARQHFAEYAPDHQTLQKAVGGRGGDELWRTVYQRVRERLQSCAVEDFRIDFEDGYGNRPDKEEDETAAFAAAEVAKGMASGELPPFLGIRIKPFTQELKRRGARTLDIFLSTLLAESGGRLPDNFVVTLPKVSLPEQVSACVTLLEHLERLNGLAAGALKIEIMTETTQGVIAADGSVAIPRIFAAALGRCRGAHFGTYDYTASCGITAAHQRMDHQACDFALLMLKNSLMGTGIWLSNGATSIMPVPVHRAEKGGSLTPRQAQENRESVHHAWKISYDHIMHSLVNGFYQGWDLHPGQLGIRYAACYAFFLEGLGQASVRLKNFMEKAAQATLVGDIFDVAATGQGLLNYFLQALGSGAITEGEIEAAGLTLAEVRTKSFVAILKGRQHR